MQSSLCMNGAWLVGHGAGPVLPLCKLPSLHPSACGAAPRVCGPQTNRGVRDRGLRLLFWAPCWVPCWARRPPSNSLHTHLCQPQRHSGSRATHIQLHLAPIHCSGPRQRQDRALPRHRQPRVSPTRGSTSCSEACYTQPAGNAARVSCGAPASRGHVMCQLLLQGRAQPPGL